MEEIRSKSQLVNNAVCSFLMPRRPTLHSQTPWRALTCLLPGPLISQQIESWQGDTLLLVQRVLSHQGWFLLAFYLCILLRRPAEARACVCTHLCSDASVDSRGCVTTCVRLCVFARSLCVFSTFIKSSRGPRHTAGFGEVLLADCRVSGWHLELPGSFLTAQPMYHNPISHSQRVVGRGGPVPRHTPPEALRPYRASAASKRLQA